jgi:hypothetical protein
MRAVSIFNVLITMVGSMGLMGLGLAIVGLYGLVAYAATRRTREIGIRMAIGANRTTVLRMVLNRNRAARGTRVGLVAAWAREVGGGVPQENDQRTLVRSWHPDRAGGDLPGVILQGGRRGLIRCRH